MMVIQAGALLALVLGGTAVVLVREPLRQAMVASIYGLLLVVTFTVLQAPDVTLSAIMAGGLAAPMLIVLAVAKVRAHDRNEQR